MARYPDAIWRPCPKHGYAGNDTHLHQGVVIHSAEGGAAGLLAVLSNPRRKASWHFHVLKNGTVYQPVDTDLIAWTNGSQEANTRFWGIENEGRGSEPLTESQYQSLLTLVKWLWVTYNLGAPTRQDNMWEHREMTRFGAEPTSCPSGRIPWARLIADMEDDMDEARVRQIVAEEFTKVFKGRDPGDLARYIVSDPDLKHAIEQVAAGVSSGGYTDARAVNAVKNKLS